MVLQSSLMANPYLPGTSCMGFCPLPPVFDGFMWHAVEKACFT